MVYLKSVENVIILGKLVGLLLMFCPPHPLPLYFVFENPKIQGMSLPCNGNYFSSIMSQC